MFLFNAGIRQWDMLVKNYNGAVVFMTSVKILLPMYGFGGMLEIASNG
jgi:hypothetical protein